MMILNLGIDILFLIDRLVFADDSNIGQLE